MSQSIVIFLESSVSFTKRFCSSNKDLFPCVKTQTAPLLDVPEITDEIKAAAALAQEVFSPRFIVRIHKVSFVTA